MSDLKGALEQALSPLLDNDELTVSGRLLARWSIDRLENTLSDQESAPWTGPVVLIASPPRTGTTFLHQMMARLPNVWTTQGYDCVAPHEAGDRVSLRTQDCVVLERLVPELPKLHPLARSSPEEMSQVMGRFGPSLQHAVLFGARAMREVLQATFDASLQHFLHWLRRTCEANRCLADARYVVLKCPSLSFFPDSVKRAFPNSTVIWLDRPEEDIRRSWAEMSFQVASRTLRFPNSARESDAWERLLRFEPPWGALELPFDELCAHPFDTVVRIDAEFGSRHTEELLGLEAAAALVRAVRPLR